ncbi:MAG: TerD family protein [Clostridia bacterium]|nr:TerD family protein [Clostridia bacterium]
MFNIPMTTSGALSASSLMSLNSTPAGGGMPTNQTTSAPNTQPGFNQAPNTQQGFNQAPNTQRGFNQPMNTQQPMQPAAPARVQRPAATGVKLKKGQKQSLSQLNPQLSEIQVCLGWDLLNQACDLDASAFMLGAGDKVVGDDWFVFYGQPTSPDGAINHLGDSTDGAGTGDDEIININLGKLDPRVQKITFVVTINEAREKGQNFSMVQNAYVRVVDKSSGKELVRFELSDYFANVYSMVVGEVYNKGGQWRFNPVGNGFAHDLAGLCGVYGVNVAD